jgi:hypothetical protein
MSDSVAEERELRAARNQAMFRSVNEKLVGLNAAFAAVAEGRYAIACECADTQCLQMLEITAGEYEDMRRQPRWFAVAPGHIYPEVERVVGEFGEYVVVEKIGAAGELAEAVAGARETLQSPPSG